MSLSIMYWTWVWASSGSWWWTGKPGVLQSVGPQRVKHDLATEQQQTRFQNQIFQFKNYYQLKGIWNLGVIGLYDPICMAIFLKYHCVILYLSAAYSNFFLLVRSPLCYSLGIQCFVVVLSWVSSITFESYCWFKLCYSDHTNCSVGAS